MAELEDLLHRARQEAEDPAFPVVHRWLAEHRGGKVIGHFQVYFPEEIVVAGGMLPFVVAGAGSSIESKMADSRIGSFVCSICRTSLELGLSGNLDFLSAFYTLPICDCGRSMAGIWGRNFPKQLAEILYIPQNANSQWAPEYLQGEYGRMKTALEKIGGAPITNTALRASIRVYNQNRRLLRELYRIKRETPWLLSTVEAYSLTRVGGMMPRAEHNALLRQVLALLPSRPSRQLDKVRVVFSGGFCEQPAIDLLEILDQSCYVVDDDLMIGTRWILDDVPEDGDPLLNLATAYLHNSTYSPVQYDERKAKEKMLLQQVRQARAEAVIVAAPKMCEPGLDDQVAELKTLEDNGIRVMPLEFEEKMTVFEDVRMQVETFVESVLFG